MYRFLLRPKWIVLHIVVLALVITMINLGLWQLRRLDQRESFNRTVREHLSAPVEPIDSVLTLMKNFWFLHLPIAHLRMRMVGYQRTNASNS